jgi:hypothetical protein
MMILNDTTCEVIGYLEVFDLFRHDHDLDDLAEVLPGLFSEWWPELATDEVDWFAVARLGRAA